MFPFLIASIFRIKWYFQARNVLSWKLAQLVPAASLLHGLSVTRSSFLTPRSGSVVTAEVLKPALRAKVKCYSSQASPPPSSSQWGWNHQQRSETLQEILAIFCPEAKEVLDRDSPWCKSLQLEKVMQSRITPDKVLLISLVDDWHRLCCRASNDGGTHFLQKHCSEVNNANLLWEIIANLETEAEDLEAFSFFFQSSSWATYLTTLQAEVLAMDQNIQGPGMSVLNWIIL